MNAGTAPLAGRTVAITRPAEQAAPLAGLVEKHGGRAVVFPVMEILDPEDTTSLDAAIARLEAFDAAIFISPNAVARGMRAIRAKRELPEALTVVALGGGSARALRELGVLSVVAPREGFDSEALLELPELREVAGKRIVIFRGTGGRPLLADTLRERGARVDYAECYRREKPSTGAAPLLDAWSRGALDALVATSSEGVRNLHAMLSAPGRSFLMDTPVFVPHPRIAEAARAIGVKSVLVTPPGDEGIAQGLVRHFAGAV